MAEARSNKNKDPLYDTTGREIEQPNPNVRIIGTYHTLLPKEKPLASAYPLPQVMPNETQVVRSATQPTEGVTVLRSHQPVEVLPPPVAQRPDFESNPAAPLPPSQSGFSNAEMAVLGGERSLDDYSFDEVFGGSARQQAQQPQMAATDLGMLKKSLENSLAGIGTMEELESAIGRISLQSPPAEGAQAVQPPAPEGTAVATSAPRVWKKEDYDRRRDEIMKRAAEVAKPTTPPPANPMSDAEAFASETTFVLPTVAELSRTRRLPWD